MKSILTIEQHPCGRMEITVHHFLNNDEMQAGIQPADQTAGLLMAAAVERIEEFVQRAQSAAQVIGAGAELATRH